MDNIDLNFRNPDAVKYTGLNGWFHVSTKGVVFCARMNHHKLLNDGHLDGIEEFAFYDDPEITEAQRQSWYEIRKWAAKKGWVHFVENHEKDLFQFVVFDDDQREPCIQLAREFQHEHEFVNDRFKNG